MDEEEQAFLADPEGISEAAFQHVAGSLLRTGGGTQAVGESPYAADRNVFAEAEHAANQREAFQLLRGAARHEMPADADEMARGSRAGAAYLRDNADSLLSELGARQARAAQSLLDNYSSLATARPKARDVEDMIPTGREIEQSRWVIETRDELQGLLAGVSGADSALGKLKGLARGRDPARWFERGSELGDDLLRLRTRAARDGADDTQLQALDRARGLVAAGLSDGSLWGSAAKLEQQRSESYARRYGAHLSAFEDAFTADGADGSRVADPERFRALLAAADNDPVASGALGETLASARITAAAAEKFGRRDQARAIAQAADQIDRASRQAAAIRMARGDSAPTVGDQEAAIRAISGGAPLGLESAPAQVDLALTALTGEPTSGAAAYAQRLAARRGTFRGAAVMASGAQRAMERGLDALLSARPESDAADTDEPAMDAPEASRGVSVEDIDGVRDHLDRMASDPDYFAGTMARAFGPMAQAAPEVYGQLVQRSAKAAQYLAAVAPGRPVGSGPFARPTTPGEDELWEFNQRLSAIADPEFVGREIASGGVSQQAVEAFQLMHPRQFEALQLGLFQRLGEMHQQGVFPSENASAVIETLTGVDGGGDPALTWDAAESAAEAAKMRQRVAGQGADVKGKSTRAAQMTSGALSTLNNGATAIARRGT